MKPLKSLPARDRPREKLAHKGAAALDALPPSVLDRAFRGEL